MTDIEKALDTVTAEVCGRINDGRGKSPVLASLSLAELGQVGAFLDARATPAVTPAEISRGMLETVKALRADT